MGTRTVDEAGAATGADATGTKGDNETSDVAPTDKSGNNGMSDKDDSRHDEADTLDGARTPQGDAASAGGVKPSGATAGETLPGTHKDAPKDAHEDDAEDDVLGTDPAVVERPERSTGVGQGAAAVVAAALGLVSLTGGWIGTVAAARETLIGQLESSSSASVAQQIQSVYGDAWKTTALWAGLFALAALVTGVVVLARPAFGAPGRPQAVWIKSVAWAGVALGVIGLLLAVLKYTGALLGLPSAP